MNKCCVWFLCFLSWSLMTIAGTYEHKDGGISIWFPDSWKIETDSDLLEATSPEEDAYAQLLVLKDIESLDEAVNVYTKELDKIFQEYKETSSGEDLELNGLKFHFTEGVGKVENVPMQVGVALIETPKAIVLVVTFNTEESGEKYQKDLDKISHSIKAI